MKVKLEYSGNDTTSIKELDLNQIPRVGDGMVIRFENKLNNREYASCIVDGVDWFITNGAVDFVVIYLDDEDVI